MQEQYVSTSQLCERYGRSARTLHRWKKECGFPSPVVVGSHGSQSRWRESDIKAWEDRQQRVA